MYDVDLLLVNPGNRLEQFANLNELATVAQPLGLAMLASFVRERGYSVAIIDGEAEFWTPERTVEEVCKYSPKLIGLSAFTTKMTSAGKILKLIKEKMPDVKTVIGGHHASAIPEHTLKNEAVDFVIKGEGFFPLVELLRALEGKRRLDIGGLWWKTKDGFIARTDKERADGIKDLDRLPFASWDLLPMNKYRAHHWQAWNYNLDLSGFAILYTSLGCPFSCEYCSVNVVYGEHFTRFRSPENVVNEMRLLVEKYGVKYIEIIDDTFTLNTQKTKELCHRIIDSGLKLRMWCFARTDRVNPELMSLMREAGIEWVFMGFEAGNDQVLKGVHKGQTVEQIKKAVDVVHSEGINIGGNYVFGLPNDTIDTMKQTLSLAQELNTEYANFFETMAYPGTKLYDVAKRKGYPLPERWGQYGFFAPDAVPMRNENLTSKEILDFRDKAFKRYFSSERYQSMIRRTFGQKIVDYINDNVLSKEIKRI